MPPVKRVYGVLCDFRYTPDVVQDAASDLPQRIGDRDNTTFHPRAMDRVSVRVDVPDADWNDRKVRLLVVIKRNNNNAHRPVPRSSRGLSSVTAATDDKPLDERGDRKSTPLNSSH